MSKKFVPQYGSLLEKEAEEMSPIVDEIAEEESEIKVCNINIDQAMEIAQKYRVMSIPTFIAFKNGEEAGRQIGAVSKGELLSLIK